jgi:hypothetical protein
MGVYAMTFLIENWYIILAVIVFAVEAGYCVYVFLKRPTSEQLKSIIEWLLYAVTQAEKELGSGTGKLKLRYVYNMFIERFSALASIITFDKFSTLVDDALTQMRQLLETNKAVQEYVSGSSTTITKEETENE